MQLPAIREKISRLPRLYKTLLLLFLVVFLALVIEGSYYLWILKAKEKEPKYINTNVAYQEGVFLYDKETKEQIAVRGWITKIDGFFLTVKSQEQEVVVEINSDFRFAEIEVGTKKRSGSLEAGSLVKEEMVKEGEERGLLKEALYPETNDLSRLISIDDLVVISDLKPRPEEGRLLEGSVLTILRQ